MSGLSVTSEMTMTSFEIATLVESRHDDVRRSIERLAGRGVISLPPSAVVKVQRERREEPVTVYQLTKRDSYVVVAQLSPEFTARLVDRWQELEAANNANPVAAMLNDPAAMRGLLLGYTEQVLQLQHKVEELAPKADFYDGVAASDSDMSVAQAAKIVGTGQNRLYQWLRNMGMVNRNNEPYQRYVDMGVLTVKVSERIHPTTGEKVFDRTTRVTGKGLVYIQERFTAKAAA